MTAAFLSADCHRQELSGPTGERNVYSLVPRTAILSLASSDEDRLVQLAAVLAVRSRAVWPASADALFRRLPPDVQSHVSMTSDWMSSGVSFDAALLKPPLRWSVSLWNGP